MNHKLLHWLAIILILITGVLHYVTAAEEYSEARYMGVLFLANFLGSLVSAFGIARRKLGWGWILGVVIAAGSILGYIQSRTVGMPGMEVEEWYDPIGIPAMFVESLFLVVFVLARPWSASSIHEAGLPSRSWSGEPMVYLSTMSLMAGIGVLHVVKSAQIYQAAKDICGVTSAVLGLDLAVIFQSPLGAEAMYVGGLFFIVLPLSLLAAYGIWRQKFWTGWAVGVFIPFGSLFGAYQSRIAEAPGVAVTGWGDPVGVAILMEVVFLIVFYTAKPWVGIADRQTPTLQARYRKPVLVTSITAIVIAIGFVSYQAGAANSANTEHHLPETVISNDMLEQEYGIRVTLVGVTAAGGMVDVRYKVIDPAKAAKLVDPEDGGIMPMVYVGNGDVMLMPDMHMRDQQLIAGRTYFNLIPNTQNAVKRGSVVTVVFEDVAVEPTLAQ
jgi:hypothetical protein